MSVIEVVDYRPEWKETFEALRSHILSATAPLTAVVEHVGSTSVPGLAAKPVIDIDVICEATVIPEMIARLESIGYQHRGDLGIKGREAFLAPSQLPKHHLYVCEKDGLAVANHLAVRNYLRQKPNAAAAYGELKKSLAQQFPHDIDAYIEGKTDFLLTILKHSNFSSENLQHIQRINQADQR